MGCNKRLLFDRSFCWFCVGFLVLMVALLVGPRVPDNEQARYCVVNAHLPGPFGVSLNCDAPEFMRLAREPSALLEPRNTRQDRPGLILAAAALARPLSPLKSLADRIGIRANHPDIGSSRIANALANDIPSYLAYIILNIAIVLATFYFFRRICTPWFDDSISATIILVAIGFLLVANDIVKAFVWSPHTQLFNVLVPVYAFFVSMRANEGAMVRLRFAVLVGLATGFGVTAYAFFAIVLPCIAVCAFIFAIRHKSRAIWWQTAVNFTVLSLCAVAPEALWMAFVRLKTGSFYQYDMAAGEVVWMLDAWQVGPGSLAAMGWSKLKLLLWLALPQAIPTAAVLIAVTLLASVKRIRAVAKPPLWPLVATSILVSAIAATFYVGVGMIVPRLAYPVIPTFIVVAAASILAMTKPNGKPRLFLACFSVAIALGTAIYTILENGPYS